MSFLISYGIHNLGDRDGLKPQIIGVSSIILLILFERCCHMIDGGKDSPSFLCVVYKIYLRVLRDGGKLNRRFGSRVLLSIACWDRFHWTPSLVSLRNSFTFLLEKCGELFQPLQNEISKQITQHRCSNFAMTGLQNTQLFLSYKRQ